MQRLCRSLRFLPVGLLIFVFLFSGCETPSSEERSYQAGKWSSKYRSREQTYTRPSIYSRRPADNGTQTKPAEPKPRRIRKPRVSKPAVVEPAPEMRASTPVPSQDPVLMSSTSVQVGEAPVYRLEAGDSIVIYLRGIPAAEMIEDVIDENGYITLPHINTVLAAGRTSSELEKAIRSEYLTQRIYRDITVNVVLPSLSYFVTGEVRAPGRYPLLSGVTLVQAIATAGGYTEFANPRKVNLTRGDDTRVIDAQALQKYPDRDIPVEAGDVIVVQRSVW